VVELAQTYTQRWSAQENIIRDFLLPLGLDYNHGYHKTPVENSEEARETGGPGKAAGKCAAVGRWSEEAFAQCQ
jgi:hypothetical protein